jgi:hypothetical protein
MSESTSQASAQPDGGETTSTGMRQEVDIRYVVTSLKGSAQHLYENVYCQRGQMENLIKLHKAQLASDRMSFSAIDCLLYTGVPFDACPTWWAATPLESRPAHLPWSTNSALRTRRLCT